jgi:hypothetical protein
MEALHDPVMLNFVTKFIGGIIIFFLVIGFIPGAIVGYFVGKAR